MTGPRAVRIVYQTRPGPLVKTSDEAAADRPGPTGRANVCDSVAKLSRRACSRHCRNRGGIAVDSPNRRNLGAVLTLAALALSASSAAAKAVAAPRLERVVIVMRHGVRPPTKSAAALAPLSDRPWPDEAAWGAAPGDLTPHGAAAIRKLGARLRQAYAAQGLLPSRGGLAAQVAIWADGADQRTRETARALGEGLSPQAPVPFGATPEGERDPLFDALDTGACPLDPNQAAAAVQARGPVDTPETRVALARLQEIVAPEGCKGGAGTCLEGADRVEGGPKGVKLTGPLGVGATLAENLLLEYESGLPAEQVGWGRLRPGDLDRVMAAHTRSADLTRRTRYIADRRAAPLARLILATLNGRRTEAGPKAGPSQRLVVLVGHDTNLSNLSGVFGLDWALPGQPDPTAPGTALAFERWRDPATGRATLRVRVIYQTPDQVRALADPPLQQVEARPEACGGRACTLERVTTTLEARLDDACPAPAPAPKRQ
jgi:4-phytase / acid phosphatase